MVEEQSQHFVAKLPDYAYVPGQTPRHSDHAFDVIRATAVLGASPDQLARCEAFLAGLQFLHAGFYWEAHEVLESVWMALPDDTVERHLVQSLIQLANGHLKLRMGRLKAALRLVGQARGLLPSEPISSTMTLELRDVRNWVDTLERDIINAL